MKMHKGHAPPSIGIPLIGGTANSVLFIDSNGKLAESNPDFTFDATNLIVGRNIISDTDSTDDLGSSSIFWANTYTDNLFLGISGGISEIKLAGGSSVILDINSISQDTSFFLRNAGASGSKLVKLHLRGHTTAGGVLYADTSGHFHIQTSQINRLIKLEPNTPSIAHGVEIKGHTGPQADSTYDLGDSSRFFRDLYVDNIIGPTVFNEAGADKDFRFEASGAPNALFIEGSSGNVGIGTTGPTDPLHVTGRIRSDDAFRIHKDGSDTVNVGPNIYIANAANNRVWSYQLSASNNIDFWNFNGTAWDRKVTFQNDTGNVGIGTTGPAATLHISADPGAAGDLLIVEASTNNAARQIFKNTEGEYEFRTDGGNFVIDDNTDSRIGFRIATNGDVSLAEDTGNVGIGVTDPSEKLEVIGGNIGIDVTTSTVGQIIQDGSRIFHTFVPSDQAPNYANIFIGKNSGSFLLDNTAQAFHGTGNIGIGERTLDAVTTGFYNFALGSNALTDVTTGQSNTAIGHQAGLNVEGGGNNVFIGRDSGVFDISGSSNIAIGKSSLRGITTGASNVGIGHEAMFDCGNALQRVIAIGRDAGRDEDTDDRLIIDNRDRTSAAATRTDAIIYGVMAAAPADQILTFNANVGIGVLDPQEKLAVAGNLVLPKTSGNGIKIDNTTPTFGFADLIGDQFSKNTGATKPTLTTYNGVIEAWLFAAGDEAFMSFHIPHDHVPGTDIFLHIHWSHIGEFVTGGTVTFKATSIYAKGHNQAPFQGTPVAGTFPGTASTTQYQHIITEVQYSASAPSGIQVDTDDLEPDGVIEMTFEVDANDLTVSEGAVPDIFIHYVDIHYRTTGLIGTKDKAPDFYT